MKVLRTALGATAIALACLAATATVAPAQNGPLRIEITDGVKVS